MQNAMQKKKNGNNYDPLIMRKEETKIYSSLMAVTLGGCRALIDTDKSLYENEIIDKNDVDLLDVVNTFRDPKTVKSFEFPKEVGVYKFDLHVKSFLANHRQDPEEWDIAIWADNFVKIEFKTQ